MSFITLQAQYQAQTPAAAQAAALNEIGRLVREFVDAHGYPMPTTPAGVALDGIDDVLLALDESGRWPTTPAEVVEEHETWRCPACGEIVLAADDHCPTCGGKNPD